MPLPSFLIKKAPKLEQIRQIRGLLEDNELHTVCESAKCPNIGECFAKKTLTFMILGNTCTRNCAFCGVGNGQPSLPDPTEPARIAAAVKKLGLNYVVITSVTRDDLVDGGAAHFADVISTVHRTLSTVHIETLVPDFQGSEEALRIILNAAPYVLNHNIETVPRLYPKIRPQANYQQSLELLARVKKNRPDIYTKSGFMVGLGERREEIVERLDDLRKVGCDIVTIGQYLPPSRNHLQPERCVTPAEFEEYQTIGRELGLQKVFAGPFVRSSYHAADLV